MGRTAVVVSGVAATLVLTGCKDGQGAGTTQPSDQSVQPSQSSQPSQASQTATPGSTVPSTSPGGPAGSAKTRLTVTVRLSPNAKAVTRTLTCDPVGGTLPHAADACAALAKAAATGIDPFAPTPKGQMCTQIYGGPEVATVTGAWNGKRINATFGRKNGCELKRWAQLAILFGPTPGAR